MIVSSLMNKRGPNTSHRGQKVLTTLKDPNDDLIQKLPERLKRGSRFSTLSSCDRTLPLPDPRAGESQNWLVHEVRPKRVRRTRLGNLILVPHPVSLKIPEKVKFIRHERPKNPGTTYDLVPTLCVKVRLN